MTVNIHEMPNSFEFHRDLELRAHFGHLTTVTAMCLCRRPHINIRFGGGLLLELSPAAMTELLRRGAVELAKLPFIPDIHDAVGGPDD